MAIADIQPGQKTAPPDSQVTPGEWHDYSHLLSPAHRSEGYGLTVHSSTDNAGPYYAARLHHNGKEVGGVSAFTLPIDEYKAQYTGFPLGESYLHPHSNLKEPHRGRRLGKAMYEALYTHAFHNGVRYVWGGKHSEAASRVHRALAAKHGLAYNGEKVWRGKWPYGGYRYELKSEAAGGEPQLKKAELPNEYALKSEQPLAKTRGAFKFPQLGMGDDRREIPIVSTPQELKGKQFTIAAQGLREYERQNIPEHARDPVQGRRFMHQLVDGQKTDMGGVSTTRQTGHARACNLRPADDVWAQLIHQNPNADVATREHENWHLMMNRVHEKHGEGGRHQLTKNLFKQINPPEQAALATFMQARYPSIPPGHPLYHEEALALLHNYLNNPGERTAFHMYKQHTPQDAQEFGNKIKSAHNQVQKLSRLADESWTKQDVFMRPPRRAIPAAPKPPQPTVPAPTPAPSTGRRPRVVKAELPMIKAEQPAPVHVPLAQAQVPQEMWKSDALVKHDTPEFRSWFAGSKVVDGDGKPLRVYHGTSKDHDFSTFKIGERGAWFTADPASASNYASDNDSMTSQYDPERGFVPVNRAPRVIPAYLSLKNPYRMTAKDIEAHAFAPSYQGHQRALFNRLKAAGHDGVDWGNGTYVAFHPHQIKSQFNARPTQHKAFNKSEEPYYHGTPHQFDEFESKPGHNTATMGLASGDAPVQRHGFFFTQNRDFANSFAGPTGRTVAARLNFGNQLDLSGPYQSQIKQFYDLMPHFSAQGLDPEHGFHHLPGSSKHKRLWQLFDGEDGEKAVAAMKAAGYDSVKFGEEDDNGQPVVTHVVFHPSQIRQLKKSEPLMIKSENSGDVWYHLTDNPRFALDPNYAPEDNSISIYDRGGRPGIYLAKSPESWVNGHNYVRPYVAEFHVHPSMKGAAGTHGRWGGEMFVPADHFDKVRLNRVIPLDAHAREKYGDHGWIESHHGSEFDTGKPIITRGRPGWQAAAAQLRGYKYPGPDVREMPEEQTTQHLQRWHQYMKENRGIDMNATADEELEKAERGRDSLIADMLGHNHKLHQATEAARFLAGGKPHDPAELRHAMWEHDGDPELAALTVYGLPADEKGLRALRGVRGFLPMQKSEAVLPTATEVQAAKTEGADVADSVRAAYENKSVEPIKLGGKHSKGTLLATDPNTGKAYLLKPDTIQGPQAGANEQVASQPEREAGFYQVVQSWGIGGYFPRTELLVIDGRQYAAIEMLDDSYRTLNDIKTEHPAVPTHLFLPFLKNGILYRWAIADWVLGQPDRNAGNVMARMETTHEGLQELPNMAETDSVRLIDEGSALDGQDFDPAHDRYSFVPYYLRAWYDGNFNQLSPEDKLRILPRLDEHAEKSVREWLDDLDPSKMRAQLIAYHAQPAACEMRLAMLKQLCENAPVDLVVNRLWAGVGPG